MPVRSYLQKVLLWYRLLSSREKVLVATLAIAFIAIIPFLANSWIKQSVAQKETQVNRAKAEFDTLQNSLERYKQLKLKREELTTKYLSSSITYEKLTDYLDSVVKRELHDASYELKPSKDDVSINEQFLAKKYSLKIKEASFEDLAGLLTTLENGPPPLFIEKLDVTKSQKAGKVSIQLEVVTIEEGKPVQEDSVEK